MQIYVPAASAVFTANGTAAGLVTVTSVTAAGSTFYEGAKAWLGATGVVSQEVEIIQVNSSTNTMVVRFWNTAVKAQTNPAGFQPGWDDQALPASSQLNYGAYSGIAAFTTVANARIEMPAQSVNINPANAPLQPS